MQWSPEAEKAIRKVPFFVRKRVRARVEKEAAAAGRSRVSLAAVKATQRRYLNTMEAEVRGYQLDSCFGPSGCAQRAVADDSLLPRIQALLDGADLLGFLQETVDGPLRFHHELRISVADCPNACSQPQIKDIGIIGACRPRVGPEACTACAACVEACPDGAVRLEGSPPGPVVDRARCLACGRCPAVCPAGTLVAGQTGYRVQLGGKLGRHPRLARELPGIHDAAAVLTIVQDCLDLYKARSRNGRRLAELLTAEDIDAYARDGRFP